ncbi:hypothetical protein [Streptomyces nigra]|uniref:hypothetical protein n=1 Tax=Streptomyces nigra TaxID=1827580 RepID=UPI00386F0E7C
MYTVTTHELGRATGSSWMTDTGRVEIWVATASGPSCSRRCWRPGSGHPRPIDAGSSCRSLLALLLTGGHYGRVSRQPACRTLPQLWSSPDDASHIHGVLLPVHGGALAVRLRPARRVGVEPAPACPRQHQ